MNINTVKLVCFSPTGTTKSILLQVGGGIGAENTELIDITSPKARTVSLVTAENELLVAAVPVYMGRVPALISDWLKSLKANHTPAVCIAVYGNRAYDNALLELRDILQQSGCKPIAGATFIAQHSFSDSEHPSSPGRPNAADLKHAEDFGRKISEKLIALTSSEPIPEVTVPGVYPYGGTTALWKVDFIDVSDRCQQCGLCASGCPAGAISAAESNQIDIDRCTLCCACIRHCPQQARSIKSGPMKEAQKRCTLFTEQKEAEFFF